ncbi:50S ribosomal protein L30 [uncultured archaeon]|nr:50S ribosomal protein L30 [uncultured archaeon]
MFAVLRVRGTSKLDGDVADTLKILHLNKPNHCVIIPDNPVYRGMLKKVQGCVAWGEIKPEVLKKLIEKRGKKESAKAKAPAKAAVKTEEKKSKEEHVSGVFKLSPPKNGFARKGVLRGFGQGGELGYQKEKINELLERMI